MAYTQKLQGYGYAYIYEVHRILAWNIDRQSFCSVQIDIHWAQWYNYTQWNQWYIYNDCFKRIYEENSLGILQLQHSCLLFILLNWKQYLLYIHILSKIAMHFSFNKGKLYYFPRGCFNVKGISS